MKGASVIMLKCIASTPISEEKLLQHLDEGGASPAVARHLEDCPYCRQRAEYLQELQGFLAAELFRADCPPAQTLGEYHLGLLEPEQGQEVAQHLAACPHCAQETDSIASFMDATEKIAPPRERVSLRKLVATLGPPPMPANGQQFAWVLRGVGNESIAAYKAGDIQVALGVDRDKTRPGRKVLIGLISQLSQPERTFENVEVHLLQHEQTISRVSTDNLGSFAIDSLKPGNYKLSLITDQEEIVIDPVQIH